VALERPRRYLSIHIKRTSKSKSVCTLGFNLKAHWSWNPSRTRIRLQVGRHLFVLVPSLVQHLVHVLELLLDGS
jgi:hypothetical protein